ncbi:MAG: hypothetical protein MJZ30_12410 [Paludibacteraceae bacterium]|nr:hypothetical protein [Paludibacteraceae bacterium]
MKHKAAEIKELCEEGLHAFGKVMTIAQQMCEGGELGERQGNGGYMGERGGYMGERYGYGMREDYPMGMREDYPMGEHGYGYMGERRGRSAMTGRYTRM